jgi:endoglucanase
MKPISFKYSPLRQRHEAVHLNQLGYRPDDPVKIGRISMWRGTGGALAAKPKSFFIVEEPSGKAVIQGNVELAKSADPMCGADLYQVDFSSLKFPGSYRLFIPDMGVSEPFRIDGNVWGDGFQAVMRGFYGQRSGIEVGPPWANFRRPQSYHPLDGVRVGLASFTLLDTNLIAGGKGSDYRALSAGESAEQTIPEVRGGYLESGDSNVRRIQHLDATRMLAELYIMFPQHYSKVALAIPEADRKEADLLDECLWNLDLFKSLQNSAGGVSGAPSYSATMRFRRNALDMSF